MSIKKIITLALVSQLWISCSSHSSDTAQTSKVSQYAIVIHGGTTSSTPDEMSKSSRDAHLEGLSKALKRGEKILSGGGTALNAVEETIKYLENHPEFNAGRGAVFTREGQHELDASIMDGQNLNTGAVTGVTTVKHPISLARRVMEDIEHVFMAGEGAEAFADEVDAERVKNSYFTTPDRAEDWDEYKRENELTLIESQKNNQTYSFGTVGAVALDKDGNIAAGTSTGGNSWKRPGRIGDSPVIGAGTYADNKSAGISATGDGEKFIRNVVAYDVAASMKYKKNSLQEAAETVIYNKLSKGDGGIIGLDQKGNTIAVFSTEGMYHGKANSEGTFEVKIWE